MYASGTKGRGIYADHLANAKRMGLREYLDMRNFINVSTDGPLNPYSKVYSAAEIVKDFPDFEVIETHKEFMHAPPLPVGWLPFPGILGWHLWATLRPRK